MALFSTEELQQIMGHALACDPMQIPSEHEAYKLFCEVRQGNAIAAEKICKLYHNMVNPTTEQNREAVRIIFGAYTKHIKPLLHHEDFR